MSIVNFINLLCSMYKNWFFYAVSFCCWSRLWALKIYSSHSISIIRDSHSGDRETKLGVSLNCSLFELLDLWAKPQLNPSSSRAFSTEIVQNIDLGCSHVCQMLNIFFYSCLFYLLMCLVSFILIWTQASENTASGGKGFQDSSCRVSCPNQPEFRSLTERTITEMLMLLFVMVFL